METLLGDPTKAKNELGWEAKCSLEELVADMIKTDTKIAKRESMLMKN